MTHSDYRSGLVGIRSASLPCRMQPGFFTRRRKIIFRLATLRPRPDQRSRGGSVHQGYKIGMVSKGRTQRRGAVACGHPATAAAAQEMLAEGGNAFDAVLAAFCAGP